MLLARYTNWEWYGVSQSAEKRQKMRMKLAAIRWSNFEFKRRHRTCVKRVTVDSIRNFFHFNSIQIAVFVVFFSFYLMKRYFCRFIEFFKQQNLSEIRFCSELICKQPGENLFTTHRCGNTILLVCCLFFFFFFFISSHYDCRQYNRWKVKLCFRLDVKLNRRSWIVSSWPLHTVLEFCFI